MENMLSYIFASLKIADENINDINKYLKRQSKLNRRFAVSGLATIAWLYAAEKRHDKERKELERRLNEQEEMINTLKGEHKM